MTLNTYEILFEYADGGTDRVKVSSTSHHAAVRDFYEAYKGERYVLSCEQVQG